LSQKLLNPIEPFSKKYTDYIENQDLFLIGPPPVDLKENVGKKSFKKSSKKSTKKGKLIFVAKKNSLHANRRLNRRQ